MRYRVVAAIVAAFALALLVLDLLLQPGGPSVTRWIDDLAQIFAVVFAAYCMFRRARCCEGRYRTTWLLAGIGACAWAFGATLWAYYELIANRPTPFPSPADVAYFLFGPLAAAGLLIRPSGAFRGWGRLRVFLDGLLLATSLLAVSWVTILEDIYNASGGSAAARAMALAYPASDVLLLTVVGVVLSHVSTANRRTLLLAAAGLTGFAVADSGFAYLTATERYATGSLIDAAWVGGFLLLGFSAVFDDPQATYRERRGAPARSALLLPYLPAAVAVMVDLPELQRHPDDSVAVVTAALVIVLLIWRHCLVLLDNRALITRIDHQARHDSLTGLANRAVFDERLEHALAMHDRDQRPLSVVLIDLDDFKTVNDTLGHPAGDQLLIHVAGVLRAAIRAGDSLARLGGDEFVIIDEQSQNPVQLAARIRELLTDSVEIDGHAVAVSASMGIAHLDGVAPAQSPALMLQQADLAMYAAKREGRGEIRYYTSDLGAVGGHDLDLRWALATSVVARQISVRYLPLLRTDGTVFGYEPDVTWNGPYAALSGANLLKAARRLGLRANLDRFVLRTAAMEAASRDPDTLMLVPVDVRTLAQSGFAPFVADIVDTANIAASRMVIEFSAHDVVESHQARGAIGALRSFGVGLAVDDLSRTQVSKLREIEPDIVKVDWQLAAGEAAGSKNARRAAPIVRMAHDIGAMLIADGAGPQVPLGAVAAAGCEARTADSDGEVGTEPASSPQTTASMSAAGSAR